jgi:hypothetical protein
MRQAYERDELYYDRAPGKRLNDTGRGIFLSIAFAIRVLDELSQYRAAKAPGPQ